MQKILVADDDKTFSNLVKRVLEMEGYRPVIVNRLADTISTVYQENPALIFMDVHIAGGDTFDILKEIKADAAIQSIPVVMTSGIDYSEKCAAFGADVFLVKPFRPNELLQIVKEILGDQDTSHGKKKE